MEDPVECWKDEERGGGERVEGGRAKAYKLWKINQLKEEVLSSVAATYTFSRDIFSEKDLAAGNSEPDHTDQ